jgi:hypothetical protein
VRSLTYEDALKLVKIAAQVHPEYQNKDVLSMAKAWALIMPEVSPKTAQAAMVLHFRTSRFWPKPAELLELVREIEGRDSDLPSAAEAWEEVEQHASRYDKHEFSCPIIERACKAIGGKAGIGEANLSSIPTIRAQFMKIYDQLKQDKVKARRRQEVAALPKPKQNRTGEMLSESREGV